MTINEALVVYEGDYVTHPHRRDSQGPDGLEALRVTKTWTNAGKTIVMFRVHALGSEWIHAEAFRAKVAKPRARRQPA